MDTSINEKYFNIFSAYSKAQVMTPYDQAPFDIVSVGKTNLVLSGDFSGGTNNVSQTGSARYEDCKLCLKPRSKITDDDAFDLAKIIHTSRYDAYIPREILIKDVKRNVNRASRHLTQPETDFFRLRCYDCGFMDIPSVIEAGYAVEK